MASLVLGTAGAYIGSSVAGGVGGAIGWAIGSAIGTALQGQDAPAQHGPRLADLKVQVSAYGATIPVAYGTVRVAGNVIWATQIQEHAEKHKEDGKGGGGQTYYTYTYTVSLAVSLCEGEIVGVWRIWADGNLIYSGRPDQPIQGEDLPITIYYGDELQMPDPTMEAYLGAGNVPGYRSQAYVVFSNWDITKYGRIPNLTFEIERKPWHYDLAVYDYPDINDPVNYVIHVPQFCYNGLKHEVWLYNINRGGEYPYYFVDAINPVNGTVKRTFNCVEQSSAVDPNVGTPIVQFDWDMRNRMGYCAYSNQLYEVVKGEGYNNHITPKLSMSYVKGDRNYIVRPGDGMTLEWMGGRLGKWPSTNIWKMRIDEYGHHGRNVYINDYSGSGGAGSWNRITRVDIEHWTADGDYLIPGEYWGSFWDFCISHENSVGSLWLTNGTKLQRGDLVWAEFGMWDTIDLNDPLVGPGLPGANARVFWIEYDPVTQSLWMSFSDSSGTGILKYSLHSNTYKIIRRGPPKVNYTDVRDMVYDKYRRVMWVIDDNDLLVYGFDVMTEALRFKFSVDGDIYRAQATPMGLWLASYSDDGVKLYNWRMFPGREVFNDVAAPLSVSDVRFSSIPVLQVLDSTGYSYIYCPVVRKPGGGLLVIDPGTSATLATLLDGIGLSPLIGGAMTSYYAANIYAWNSSSAYVIFNPTGTPDVRTFSATVAFDQVIFNIKSDVGDVVYGLEGSTIKRFSTSTNTMKASYTLTTVPTLAGVGHWQVAGWFASSSFEILYVAGDSKLRYAMLNLTSGATLPDSVAWDYGSGEITSIFEDRPLSTLYAVIKNGADTTLVTLKGTYNSSTGLYDISVVRSFPLPFHPDYGITVDVYTGITAGTYTGFLWMANGLQLIAIDKETGAVMRSYDVPSASTVGVFMQDVASRPGRPDYRRVFYTTLTTEPGDLTADPLTLNRLDLDVRTIDYTYNVGGVVADLSYHVGLTDTDIDVTELTDQIDGYIVTGQSTGRAAIEPLSQGYFFQQTESGQKIVFRKLGAAPIADWPQDDLAATGE